jgi:hypothetical protein
MPEITPAMIATVAEPGRGRPSVGHHVGDLAAGERATEVAGQHALHVIPVLLQEGLVEVVELGERRPLGRGDGSFADQCLDGVVLVGEHQRIDDERGPEEGQDHLKYAPHNEAEHTV